MSNKKGFWCTLTPEQKKAALEYRGPENIGPCMKYCAVLDECNARGDAIERLTRERGEVLGEALYWKNGCNAALDRAEAAERKVEKLREALSFVGNIAHAEGDTAGICDIVRVALAETEKGDA